MSHRITVLLLFFVNIVLNTCTANAAEPLPHPALEKSLAHYKLKGPKAWHRIDDPSQLPSKVKLVYVGAGKSTFTPSINLAVEETDLTVEAYVLAAKEYHESQTETTLTRLGNLKTKKGVAELLQIDKQSSLGEIRFLQAIIIDRNTAYVITATSLKEEFNKLNTTFFHTIQSFDCR